MVDSRFRELIEDAIGRPLADDELAPQASLATLSLPVREIVLAIAGRVPLCAAYLTGLVPGLRVSEVNVFLDELARE